MEDKLVTLAIHTYQKAQMIKLLLESEGIEVYLHNVNLIQPVVSAGVRVRIKESDLPAALRIIEELKLGEDEISPDKTPDKKCILVPVDFSDYSLRACELASFYAKDREIEVHLLHVFFAPFFPNTIALSDEVLPYRPVDEEAGVILQAKADEEMKKFESLIRKKQDSSEWPEVPCRFILRNGLPEEEIRNYSEEVKPELIVMGTRGKNQKDADLIGSVTAEVLDMVRFPILAIPEETPFFQLSKARKIAFGTSFEQKDLVVFDRLFRLLDKYPVEYCFFHLAHQSDVWDEIKLAGIRDYFEKQYPAATMEYKVVKAKDFALEMERFVIDNSIDIIALPTYRRNIFARMFNPSMARKMLFHTNTPILTLRF